MNEVIAKSKFNIKAHRKLYFFSLFVRNTSFYFIMLLVLVMAGMIIYNTTKAEDSSLNYISYILVGVTLILTPLMMIIRISSQVKKEKEARKDTYETILINKEKISRKIEGLSPVVISWKQIEKVYEKKDYFFFFIGEDQSLILDKASFTQGTSEDFIRLFEKYGPKNKKGKPAIKKLKEKK